MIEIELGKEVIDNITGLVGYAVMRCESLSGVIQYGIQPKCSDATPPPLFYQDACYLSLTGNEVCKIEKFNMGFQLRSKK